MLRSEDTVLYDALVFVPEGGSRGCGRPGIGYDTIKCDLADRNVIVDHRNQEQFCTALAARAADRKVWSRTIEKGGR